MARDPLEPNGQTLPGAETREQAFSIEDEEARKSKGGSSASEEFEKFRANIATETSRVEQSVIHMQVFLRQIAETKTPAILDLSGRDSAELDKLLQSTTKQAGELAEVSKKLKAEAEARLQKIAELEMESGRDISSLVAWMDEISATILLLKEQSATLPTLVQNVKEISKSYQAARIKEAGYGNSDSLRAAYWEKTSERQQLEKKLLGTGRFWNKDKINILSQEIVNLGQIKDQEYRHLSVPGEYGGIGRYEVGNLASALVNRTVQRVMDRYEKQLAEFQEQEGREPLDEEALESLNDDYLRTHVRHEIDRKKQDYRRMAENNPEYGQHLTDLEDSEKVEKFFDLAKRCYKISLTSFQSNPEDEARRIALIHEIQELPRGFQQLSSYVIHQEQEPENQRFQRLAKFVKSARDWEKRHFVQRAYEGILGSLRSLNQEEFRDANIYFEHTAWQMRHKLDQLKSSKQGQKLDDFLIGFDEDRWDAMRQNPRARELLGAGQIEDAHKFIADSVSTRILDLDKHTDQCIRMGQRLYNYPEAKYTPMAILNAYREPGYSGEMPFLSVHTSPDNTMLFKYISSLAPEELEKLKAMNIPGCAEIVELIRANPGNFSWPSLRTAEKDEDADWRFIDNPVYNQIQKHLAEMSVHFLKTGQHKMDFYLMGVLDYLRADLGEGYELMLKVLTGEADQRTKKAVLDTTVTRISRKDERAAIVFMGAYGELSEAEQGML
ncbi:MAG: hypothetical protein Q8R08_03940, partial [bacterium]|nr:hypothetical protein [bacterium]